MSSSSTAVSRYGLSFTVGGLLEREAGVLARAYIEQRDWETVRDIAVRQNLLQSRTHSSGVRLARETVKRLGALSDREVEMLVLLPAADRGHLMWVAACRCYGLIGDFAEEVLRERFLTLAGGVSYEHFDSFYLVKALWHDELDAISVSTYRKLRQVLFKMMVDARLLTAAGAIEPALLSPVVVERLAEQEPSDIRFFPTRLAA